MFRIIIPITIHSVELVPAMVEDDPIFLTKTFQDESTGHKRWVIWCIITSPRPRRDKDETYNNELRQQFGAFKAEGSRSLCWIFATTAVAL